MSQLPARRGAQPGAGQPAGHRHRAASTAAGRARGSLAARGNLPQTRSEREKRNKAPEREREKTGEIIKQTNKIGPAQSSTLPGIRPPPCAADLGGAGGGRAEPTAGIPEGAHGPLRSAELCEGSRARPVPSQRRGGERREAGSAPGPPRSLRCPRLWGGLRARWCRWEQNWGQFCPHYKL